MGWEYVELMAKSTKYAHLLKFLLLSYCSWGLLWDRNFANMW